MPNFGETRDSRLPRDPTRRNAHEGALSRTPERGHGWPATAARASDPAPAKPRRPRHVSLALPPLAADGSPMSPTLAKGPAQHTTEAMLQALGADGWGPAAWDCL